MSIVTASYLYSGLPDYFGGHGCTQGREALLYARYGRDTTLKDLIDEAVDDFYNGPAGEEFHEEITDGDVRAALLEMLNARGRADYASGAVCEFAESYADANGPLTCADCDVVVGCQHAEGCEFYDSDGGDDNTVLEEDCEDYDGCCDSPVVIFLLESNACTKCGNESDDLTVSGDYGEDNLCPACEDTRWHDENPCPED